MVQLPRAGICAALVSCILVLADCNRSTEPTSRLVDGWSVIEPAQEGVLAIAGHSSGWSLAVLPISPATENTGYSGVGAVVARSPDDKTMTVYLDAGGRPRMMVLEGTVAVFRNWRPGLVDVGLVASNGSVSVVRDVAASDAVGSMLLGAQDGRSQNAVLWGARDWLRVGATVLDIASCAGAIAMAGGTFGAGAVFAGVVCGANAFQIAARWAPEDDASLQASGDAFALVVGALPCAVGSVSSCIDVIFEGAVSAMDIAANLALDLGDELATVEGALATGSGDVQVTLTWNNTADLDLHVTDPSGFRIYYGNRTSPSGGTLDVDDTNGYGPENVYWRQGGAPSGTYQVEVDHFSGASPAAFTVLVQAFGYVSSYVGRVSSTDTGRKLVVTFASRQPLPITRQELVFAESVNSIK